MAQQIINIGHTANDKSGDPIRTAFDKVNQNIKTQELVNKKFCCLINSHDNNKTRIPTYASLIKYGKIDCPGKLLNNMKPIGSSSEDKIKFMNNYIFNICSENGIGVGYFTEKLPQCVDALCLPVYSGDINKFNSNIFNIKRIITDCDKVQELIKDKQKLVDFYQQDIYNKDAYKYIINIQNIVKLAINNLFKNLKCITTNFNRKFLYKFKKSLLNLFSCFFPIV